MMKGRPNTSSKKYRRPQRTFTAIVLAAGRGKRMRSSRPKVLYELAGRPLVCCVLDSLFNLCNRIAKVVVVVGYKKEAVVDEVQKYCSAADIKKKRVAVEFVHQKQMLGTADAVKAALGKVKTKNILVLCGDAPLITSATLSAFTSFFLRKKVDGCLVTSLIQDKNSLGMVVRGRDGTAKLIAEKSETLSGPIKKSPRGHPEAEEVNSGIYCFRKRFLAKVLPRIAKNKRKREYFLTDVAGISYRQGRGLSVYRLKDPEEVLGINSQTDLLAASRVMRQRILGKLTAKGVYIVDPDSVFVEAGVTIGKNSVIYPFTFIEKDVIIGSNCFLGPFLRIRKKTVIGNNVHLGNFLEVNRSRIKSGTKAKHFGYLGDVFIAEGVNIGAGTVVANYDGKAKHQTNIGNSAFIGSDTVLVAPVKIGSRAATAAGSIVTKDVRSGAIVAGVPARQLKGKRR